MNYERYKAKESQWKKIYAPDKDFTHDSSMTLTLVIKPWFKVIAHPLIKDTLWEKYEQN